MTRLSPYLVTFEYDYLSGSLIERKRSLLSCCISEYLELIKVRNAIGADNYILEISPILNLFVEVIGDKEIEKLQYEDAIKFTSILNQLPKNRAKKFGSETSLRYVIQETKAKELSKLSARTKNKYLSVISTFLSNYVATGKITHNFFSNKLLYFKESMHENENRAIFSIKDLKNIFQNGKYFGGGERDKFFKDVYFWSLLLALFQGMRLEEIVQLHVTDIIKIEGIWCVQIQSNTKVGQKSLDFKRLKNDFSSRVIPIHDELLRLGFLNKVQAQKNKNEIRLFSEIKTKKKGKVGYVVGEWFRRNKLSYYKIHKQNQAFHSFRHTFINHLKQQSVAEGIASQLAGHRSGGITYNVYGKDYNLKILKEQGIDKINYRINWKILRKKSINPWFEETLIT